LKANVKKISVFDIIINKIKRLMIIDRVRANTIFKTIFFWLFIFNIFVADTMKKKNNYINCSKIVNDFCPILLW